MCRVEEGMSTVSVVKALCFMFCNGPASIMKEFGLATKKAEIFGEIVMCPNIRKPGSPAKVSRVFRGNGVT